MIVIVHSSVYYERRVDRSRGCGLVIVGSTVSRWLCYVCTISGGLMIYIYYIYFIAVCLLWFLFCFCFFRFSFDGIHFMDTEMRF